MQTRRLKNLLMVIVAAGVLPAATVTVQAQQEDTSALVYQVQELLEEVRELRGMVEAQQREIENLRRRQRDQYLDLDQRLQEIDTGEAQAAEEPADASEPIRPVAGDDEEAESGTRPARDEPEVRDPINVESEVTPLAEPGSERPRDMGTPGEDEQAAYNRAFRALRETRYADAAEGFNAFLEEYPDSSYAPNALYWLGETYYVTRDFETALEIFDELLEDYPGSSKEGDALLKIGFSYYELEQFSEARAALEQVRSEHAGTTLARLAESRLRDMRLAGHY